MWVESYEWDWSLLAFVTVNKTKFLLLKKPSWKQHKDHDINRSCSLLFFLEKERKKRNWENAAAIQEQFHGTDGPSLVKRKFCWCCPPLRFLEWSSRFLEDFGSFYKSSGSEALGDWRKAESGGKHPRQSYFSGFQTAAKSLVCV